MDTVTYKKQANGLTKVDMEEYFDEVEIDSLYQWIDRIPLSRPKKNISKDFADAVLCGEVVAHYFPKDVDIHNYTPAASTKQKLVNWVTLNKKVLRRLDLDLSEDVLRALANGKLHVIEKVLMLLRLQIDRRLERSGRDFIWRRKELYHIDPLYLRLPLSETNQEEENTPHGIKSPRGQGQLESSSRTMSPGGTTRQTKSEPVNSPRKYNKGEIPHGHPDRTMMRYNRHAVDCYPIDALNFDIPPYYERLPWSERYHDIHGVPYHGLATMSERAYLADKPLALIPRPFLPPVSDNVPRVLYEEKETECQAKEETIQILNAKIRRLEHLLHLKDVRIDDLHTSLQQTIGLGYSTRRR